MCFNLQKLVEYAVRTFTLIFNLILNVNLLISSKFFLNHILNGTHYYYFLSLLPSFKGQNVLHGLWWMGLTTNISVALYYFKNDPRNNLSINTVERLGPASSIFYVDFIVHFSVSNTKKQSDFENVKLKYICVQRQSFQNTCTSFTRSLISPQMR